MTSQHSADIALQIWQANRALSPEQRIELAFFDYILPPETSTATYEAQLNAVANAMRVA
jgi:hypothetical protein